MSKSLIVDNHFVMLFNKQLLKNGRINYNSYNRFPVFPFYLTGAVMQVFEPDLTMQIYAARQLMNMFIIVAFLLSIKLIRELIGDKYLSLSVSLCVFSAYYILYYSDMIFIEIPTLFGFVLALYLVVRSREDFLRKSMLYMVPILCVATGWQIYAVFMSWFCVDVLARFLYKKSWRDFFAAVFSGRAFTAFVIAVVFGALILGTELMLEWNLAGGKLMDQGSTRSIIGKFGSGSKGFEWDVFWGKQVYRIVNMIIPFSGILTGHLKLMKKLSYDWLSFSLGITSALVSGLFFIYGLIKFRDKIRQKIGYYLFFIFILSGFFWSIPMRHHNAYHDYQTPFYIGFSFMYFAVISFYVKPTYIKTVAFCSCLLFVVSVYQMNEIKSVDSERLNAITEEFEKIYVKLPKFSKVFVDSRGLYKDEHDMDVGRNELSAELGIGGQSIDFFLVGHYRAFPEDADYIVSKNPDYNGERLTDNPTVNLFRNTTE